jgi:hypothetical protein
MPSAIARQKLIMKPVTARMLMKVCMDFLDVLIADKAAVF